MSSPTSGIVLTGLDLVDRSWGGLRRGRMYVVEGEATAERRLITNLFVQTGAAEEDTVLVAVAGRPDPLLAVTAQLDGHVRRAHEAGRLHLVRLMASAESGTDEERSRALRQLIEMLHKWRPQRVVVHELQLLLPCRTLERRLEGAIELSANIRALNAATLLLTGECTSVEEERALQFVRERAAGSISATRSEGTVQLALQPFINGPEEQVVQQWDANSIWETAGEAEEEADEDPTPRSGRGQTSRFEEVPHSTYDTAYVPLTEEEAERGYQPHTYYGPDPSASRGSSTDVEARTNRSAGDGGASLQEAEDAEPQMPEKKDTYRESFRARVQQHYLKRDVHGTPFVLVAIRLDPAVEGLSSEDFDYVGELVSRQLGPEDDLYVDAGSRRIVALLSDSTPEAADAMFSRIEDSLVDDEAERILAALAAIVVPDGKPFQTAEEFVAYAVEEERG